MILSDSTIRGLIDQNVMAVDPTPDEIQYQPASLDIRIGDTLRDPETDEPLDTLTVEPHTRYHAYTREHIDLPNFITAQLTGRSSIGRAGIQVHCTAGWFDPGFRGYPKLEIYSFRDKTDYPLVEGERVAQLVFSYTDRETSGYDGQFQGQGPQ